MKKKIGLVIQGALMSVGRTGDNMRKSPEELIKEGGVVHYDCRDNINETIQKYGHLFDEIFVSVFDNQLKPGDHFPGAKIVSAPDPGSIKQEGHYKDNNKHRQFISTLNGLIELEKSGIEYAIKTRTDISLDLNEVIESFFAELEKSNNPDIVGATVVHPKTFLLHDLYFIASVPALKKFCQSLIAYDKFEFISSVHRDMLLKHAYVEYRDKIGVPGWAYFPFYPPIGASAETRKIFDYMFKNVYFSLKPETFKSTLWRGTYFPEDHIASLTKGDASSRRYNIPALISMDWRRYFHFRSHVSGQAIGAKEKLVIMAGELGWQAWQMLRKMLRYFV